MAAPRMDVSSFVGKLLEEEDVDLPREGVRVLAQALMETEVSGQIGAAPYERSSSRSAYRNGYRTRTWEPGSARSSFGSPRSRPAATSLAPRATPAGRAGVAGRDRRGLREGRVHPQGRRPGPGVWDRRDQPLRSLQDLQGAR